MPRKIPKYMRESPNRLPVDQSRLSEKSLRSWSLPEYYTDERYRCVGCGKECVFTAETQKEWYEDQGKFFWERPDRCEDCHSEWRSLRKDIKFFPELLRGDPTSEQLLTMKEKMERFKALGGRHDLALYNRILRFIEKAAGGSTP